MTVQKMVIFFNRLIEKDIKNNNIKEFSYLIDFLYDNVFSNYWIGSVFAFLIFGGFLF